MFKSTSSLNLKKSSIQIRTDVQKWEHVKKYNNRIKLFRQASCNKYNSLSDIHTDHFQYNGV
jgi:hypothetical protein